LEIWSTVYWLEETDWKMKMGADTNITKDCETEFCKVGEQEERWFQWMKKVTSENKEPKKHHTPKKK
jgi:hypothetical protein